MTKPAVRVGFIVYYVFMRCEGMSAIIAPVAPAREIIICSRSTINANDFAAALVASGLFAFASH